MEAHLTKYECDGSQKMLHKKFCISHAVNGKDMLWIQSEKVENVGTSVKKKKALSVKMNT
jgi:hypothetical protein